MAAPALTEEEKAELVEGMDEALAEVAADADIQASFAFVSPTGHDWAFIIPRLNWDSIFLEGVYADPYRHKDANGKYTAERIQRKKEILDHMTFLLSRYKLCEKEQEAAGLQLDSAFVVEATDLECSIGIGRVELRTMRKNKA